MASPARLRLGDARPGLPADYDYPQISVRNDARVIEMARPKQDGWARLQAMLGPLFQTPVPMSKAEVLEAAGATECLIRAVAFSPVAPLLAVAKSNSIVEVYGVPAAARPAAMLLKPERQREILALQWSPTQPGVLAMGTMDGATLCTMDLGTQEKQHYLALGSLPVTSLAFSPNGLYLATASPAERAITIWDLKDGSSQVLHRGSARLLRWSPSGNHLLVAGTGNYVGLLSPVTGQPLFVRTPLPVAAACWTAEGKAVLGLQGSGKLYYLTINGATPVLSEFHDALPTIQRGAKGITSVDVSPLSDYLALILDDGDEPQLIVHRLARDGSIADTGAQVTNNTAGWQPRAAAFNPGTRLGTAELGAVWAFGREAAEVRFKAMGR
eukprot:m.69545 g.69545  ORF g.69545 m.69545 type:complete len:384 (+) comp7553_c0_seq2:19-1170(+)